MKSGENRGSHWSLCLCVKKRGGTYLVRWKKEKSWEKISLGEKERTSLLISPPLLKVETVETGKRQKKLGYCPHYLFTKKWNPTFLFFFFSVFASCYGIWEKVGLFLFEQFTRFVPAELIKKGWKKGELSVFSSISWISLWRIEFPETVQKLFWPLEELSK